MVNSISIPARSMATVELIVNGTTQGEVILEPKSRADLVVMPRSINKVVNQRVVTTIINPNEAPAHINGFEEMGSWDIIEQTPDRSRELAEQATDTNVLTIVKTDELGEIEVGDQLSPNTRSVCREPLLVINC